MEAWNVDKVLHSALEKKKAWLVKRQGLPLMSKQVLHFTVFWSTDEIHIFHMKVDKTMQQKESDRVHVCTKKSAMQGLVM